METYDTLLDGVRTEFNMNDKYYYQVDYGTNQDTNPGLQPAGH